MAVFRDSLLLCRKYNVPRRLTALCTQPPDHMQCLMLPGQAVSPSLFPCLQPENSEQWRLRQSCCAPPKTSAACIRLAELTGVRPSTWQELPTATKAVPLLDCAPFLFPAVLGVLLSSLSTFGPRSESKSPRDLWNVKPGQHSLPVECFPSALPGSPNQGPVPCGPPQYCQL